MGTGERPMGSCWTCGRRDPPKIGVSTTRNVLPAFRVRQTSGTVPENADHMLSDTLAVLPLDFVCTLDPLKNKAFCYAGATTDGNGCRV